MSKFQTILKQGLDPYKEGKKNFKSGSVAWDEKAKERLKICLGCEHFNKEPISFLRIKDERIPEISGKMCGDCGCELPYKLRQSISLCEKWNS